MQIRILVCQRFRHRERHRDRVRVKDGKLHTPNQLELKLPKFIDAAFVDIGDQMPFYQDHMTGPQRFVTSSDDKVRAQICVLGSFLPVFGNISVLRGFWGSLGTVMDHKLSFL